MTRWIPDVLGEPYQQHTIDLGDDPDGEGEVVATVVRRLPVGQPEAAVIYVHGYTDYFFNTELAEYFTDRGFAFYAVDLRKCGRSMRPGQSPHYVRSLSHYDADFNAALRIARTESPDAPVYLLAHSTGGLSAALWLDRINQRAGGTLGEGIVGAIFNSPWFDLQGAAWTRTLGTQAIRAIAQLRPNQPLVLPRPDGYGSSLHSSRNGEWDFDLTMKPLTSFPIRVGWLNAVRRGQARLHQGLNIGVPSLVLRSARSKFLARYTPDIDTVDAVLDTKQIARWTGCLGNAFSSIPLEGARHDVFLSQKPARELAYAAVDDWLDRHAPDRVSV